VIKLFLNVYVNRVHQYVYSSICIFAKHKLILGGIFKFFFEVDQKKDGYM